MFLKILQNFTGKDLCCSLFLMKLQTFRLQHRCFLVKFAKILRTSILKNIFEQLLNSSQIISSIHPIVVCRTNWLGWSSSKKLPTNFDLSKRADLDAIKPFLWTYGHNLVSSAAKSLLGGLILKVHYFTFQIPVTIRLFVEIQRDNHFY